MAKWTNKDINLFEVSMYYVYRYMIGDQWIYVGKSENNLKQRIYSHAKESKFSPYSDAVIEYCELSSKTDMDITESMLIKTMHPIINVVDKTDGSIPFNYDASMINWKPISDYEPESKPEASKKKQIIQRQPYLNNNEIKIFIANILAITDPLGLRLALDEWCRIEDIMYDEAYEALSVPQSVERCDFLASLRKHLNSITRNTSYKYQVHDNNDQFILVLGRVGRDNISDYLL